MSRLAFPYVRPAGSLFEATPWSILVDGEATLLPSELGDWDYNLDLNIRRTVHIDAAAVRRQSLLPHDAPIDICVVWRSTGSGLFGRASRLTVPVEEVSQHILEATIPGSDVGGTLDIDTVVVLSRSLDEANELAPHRAGSLLWKDRATIRLQGDASQFPIAIVDFKESSLPDEAGWHVHISGSLHAAAMGSVLLLVNERNKAVAHAIKKAGKPSASELVVLSAIYTDVARTLVEYALASDDFTDESSFDEETLGAMLMDVFDQMLGGLSIRDVRLRVQDNPSLVATYVQAASRIFGGDR